MDDKKFKNFKKIKKKQLKLGDKLKPVLRITTPGVGTSNILDNHQVPWTSQRF